MKTILFAIILFLSSSYSFAQIKVPTYIFGRADEEFSGAIHKGGGTEFFQFFADSTFTLTKYSSVSKYFYQIKKNEHRGKYVKTADTLFLIDSASIGYPFTKDSSHFNALVKDVALRLYPAKIVLTKDKDTFITKATYLIYLNISRKLKSLDLLNIINLEMEYNHFLMERFW